MQLHSFSNILSLYYSNSGKRLSHLLHFPVSCNGAAQVGSLELPSNGCYKKKKEQEKEGEPWTRNGLRVAILSRVVGKDLTVLCNSHYMALNHLCPVG